MVNGDVFSCEISARLCCRRLNSFSLSVVNCDVTIVVVVVVERRDEDDDVLRVVVGGLFSISVFTLSKLSIFKSGLTVGFASFDDVDEEVDGGLPSKSNDACVERKRIETYKVNKDRDVVIEMMFRRLWQEDVNSLDE